VKNNVRADVSKHAPHLLQVGDIDRCVRSIVKSAGTATQRMHHRFTDIEFPAQRFADESARSGNEASPPLQCPFR
jgi:hypothetical protein